MEWLKRVFSKSDEERKNNGWNSNGESERTNEVKFFKDIWTDLEELAIEVGLTIEEFWELCPRTFNKYVNVYNKKREEEIEQIDTLNFLLGKYIAYAFNDVKHYPKKPFLENETKKTREMNELEMERVAMFNVMKLGGKIDDRGTT